MLVTLCTVGDTPHPVCTLTGQVPGVLRIVAFHSSSVVRSCNPSVCRRDNIRTPCSYKQAIVQTPCSYRQEISSTPLTTIQARNNSAPNYFLFIAT